MRINKLGPSAISPCVALALGELNFTYQYRVSGGATKGWPVKLRHQIPIEFSLPTRSLGWPSQLRNLGKSFTSIAMRINGSLNGRMARGNRSPCYCERMSYCECINRRRTDNENKIEYKLESPHTGFLSVFSLGVNMSISREVQHVHISVNNSIITRTDFQSFGLLEPHEYTPWKCLKCLWLISQS